MIITARTLITRAFRLVNIFTQAQVVPPDDMVDAFDSLNEMVDGWKTDNLTVYATTRQEFPLVTSQSVYSLGDGGDFDVPRVNWIPEASIITNNNPAQPLELPLDILDIGQWQAVPVKATQSALPRKLYIKWSNPLLELTFWPVPNISNLEVALYLPFSIDQFATLDTQYDLPGGYYRALRYNLAMEMVPEWGVDIQEFPTVPVKAAEYLGDIRRVNNRPQMIGVDEALIGKSDLFNYYTGEPL